MLAALAPILETEPARLVLLCLPKTETAHLVLAAAGSSRGSADAALGGADGIAGEAGSVGFIGVGYMGAGMVANLVRRGFRVEVFNRSRSKCEQVRSLLDAESSELAERVTIADSPADVARHQRQIHLCLASEGAATATLSGEGGVLGLCEADPGALEGKLLIDHGTVSPGFCQDTHATLAGLGAGFLDAPISGGPEGAINGTLAIMVGGAEPLFAQARPALDAMGTHVVHMGNAGTGCTAKLVNQTLVAAHAMAAAEAIAYAESMGIERLDVMMELLNNSFGNSVVLQRSGKQFLNAKASGELPGPLLQSAAPLRLITKDLKFILRGARAPDAPKLQLAETALAKFEGLCEAGFGEADSALVAWKLQHEANSAAAATDGAAAVPGE